MSQGNVPLRMSRQMYFRCVLMMSDEMMRSMRAKSMHWHVRDLFGPFSNFVSFWFGFRFGRFYVISSYAVKLL